MKKPVESTVMWTPERASTEAAQISQFARCLGLEGQPYERLHRYSIMHMEEFWSAFWDFAEISGDKRGPAVRFDEAARMTGTKFFPDTKLNFAENMLKGEPDEIAVIEADENGVGREVTLAELRRRVASAQRGLQSLGVAPGDRVAGMLPNDLDALVALLATAALGGVWSTCAPEFGETGVVDRFGQISPRVLIVASDYLYNGRRHEIAAKAGKIAARLEGLEHIVVIGDAEVPQAPCQVHRYSELCQGEAGEPSFARLPFNHPLYIVYTSGTTGLPKCIVHGSGGTLLNLRKEHMLHCDVQPGDRMLYYTNTAWMMYHWLVAARASGAGIVLYDGAPIPKKQDGTLLPGVLWEIAERAGVTHFGTSPKYLTLVQQEGYRPGQQHDLGKLRMIMSAGAPLTVENFDWVYSEVKADLCLASISGGTEILGCFVMGNPTQPVRAGEIQGPALGMAVNVLDERNAPVLGRKGDLVCTEPFPSMPLEFWGEGGWQRYLDTYFSDRPEIWTHGDLAQFTDSGGMIISGRTDTTLKPGGVRIGTGEIYRVVESVVGVTDSLVIGYPVEDDMEIWLFVVCDNGKLEPELEATLRERLRKDASPRHVPKRIISVPEIPYTLSGKKVEKAVLQTVMDIEVKNRGSLINPDCLKAFRLTSPEQPRTEEVAE